MEVVGLLDRGLPDLNFGGAARSSYASRNSGEVTSSDDPWHDKIADFVSTRLNGVWFTTAEVLGLLGIEEARRDRIHEMRVGAVLHRLQCERRKQRIGPNKKPRWAYRQKPTGDEENSRG